MREDKNLYEALLLISKNASISAFPVLILPVAVFFLSEMASTYRWEFGIATMGTVLSLLAMAYHCKKFPESKKEQIGAWERRFYLVRGLLYIFTSVFMLLGFLSETKEQSWIMFVLFAVWIATIENISAIYSPRLQMARAFLVLFSILTLGYGFFVQSPLVHTLEAFALVYLLSNYFKISRFHKQFLALVDLKVAVVNEKNKLEELLDIIPVNLAWISREQSYLHVNSNLAKLLGTKKETIIGKSIGYLHGTETEFYQKIQTFDQSKANFFKYEASMKAKSGEIVWVEFRFHKLEAPREGQIILISKDITEQKSIEKQIEIERLSKLESARLASLGEMAAGIAHEINNPLAVISGRADILLEELNKPEISRDKIRDSGTRIRTTVIRISKIINSMRVLARDGKSDPFERVQLSEVIQQAVDLSPERLRAINAELFVNVPQSIMIWCRPVQIAQVVVNLLGNSLDAISGLVEKWVKIEAVTEGNLVLLSVSDSGPGIPLEIRKRLMQPFFTTKPPGKGTGLGLSLSQHIVQDHQGEFYYDENSPHTKFVIKLPLKGDQIKRTS